MDNSDTAGEVAEGEPLVGRRFLTQRYKEAIENPELLNLRSIRFFEVPLIAIVCVMPNLLLIALFSHMGMGLSVYNALNKDTLVIAYDSCAVLFVLVLMVYYVLDFENWGRGCKACALLLPFGLACVVAGMLAASHPNFITMAGGIVTFYLLAKVRHTCLNEVKREQFWGTASACLFLCGVATLTAFGFWWTCGGAEWCDTGAGENNAWNAVMRKAMAEKAPFLVSKHYSQCGTAQPNTSLEAQAAQRHSCTQDNTALYFIWAEPLIVGAADIVGASFVLLIGVLMEVAHDSELLSVTGSLKLFIMALGMTLFGFYTSTGALSAVSVDLSDAVVSFMLVGLTVSVVWVVFETNLGEELVANASRSQFVKMMLDFLQGDWGRAMMAGTVGIFAPFYLLANWLRKKYRRSRGHTTCQERLCEHGYKAVEEITKWPTVGVFLKICLLGELFFTFQVGVAKMTFVFLSWLNDFLTDMQVEFSVVLALVFAVGFTMFLLPPVPGVPVYVFCGIVIAKQGEALFGFYPSVGLAVVLGFALKLVASTAQYGIGYAAGKNVKVQQLIGVDKVPTRAIETILRQPGLKRGKVAVLVGGPDWPTSVTCGILKLSVPQMLLGTVPVIIVLSPCVLAGAFMAQAKPGVLSTAATLAGVFLGLSSLMQGMSMFEAMRTITNTVINEGEELAKHRDEHTAVEQLTIDEQAYTDRYLEVTDWKKLHILLKLMIMLAAFLIYSSCAVWAFKGSMAFENFQVSGHIKDPLDSYGLGGDASNIVRKPIGWILLGMFFVGVSLHILFSKITGCIVKTKPVA